MHKRKNWKAIRVITICGLATILIVMGAVAVTHWFVNSEVTLQTLEIGRGREIRISTNRSVELSSPIYATPIENSRIVERRVFVGVYNLDEQPPVFEVFEYSDPNIAVIFRKEMPSAPIYAYDFNIGKFWTIDDMVLDTSPRGRSSALDRAIEAARKRSQMQAIDDP